MQTKFLTPLLAAVCVGLAAPAWAINKCAMADGRVAYQDAPCSSEAKTTDELKTWTNSSGGARDTWRFERNKDEMTGKLACGVFSPLTTPKVGSRDYKFIPVRVVLIAMPDGEYVGVRTGDDKDLFHNDLEGMGVRTDRGKFIPLTNKLGSHVVTISNNEQLVAELEKSQRLFVRARFWPYDTLFDMDPISTAGFNSALKQARSCIRSLSGN